jgi:hypothetical protein
MIGPLARLPQGLLGFLDVRNDGEYPNQLSTVIQPTLEIIEFMNANALEPLIASQNSAAVGGFGFAGTAQPGAGEYWWVRGALLNAVTAVGENIRLRPMIGRTQGAGFQQNWVGDFGTSSLTDAAGVGAAMCGFPRGFLLCPGDQLMYGVEKITTAGNINVVLLGHILRFR